MIHFLDIAISTCLECVSTGNREKDITFELELKDGDLEFRKSCLRP